MQANDMSNQKEGGRYDDDSRDKSLDVTATSKLIENTYNHNTVDKTYVTAHHERRHERHDRTHERVIKDGSSQRTKQTKKSSYIE